MRARTEIHHQPDHLVPPKRAEHLAYGALRRDQLHVLVRPVRDKEIHEPLVLELVADDVERHLVRDASAADLEVPEVHRDEDEPAPVLARGPNVRQGTRIHGDDPLQVL